MQSHPVIGDIFQGIMNNLSKYLCVVIASVVTSFFLSACSEPSKGIEATSNMDTEAIAIEDDLSGAEERIGSEQSTPQMMYVSVYAPRSLWDIRIEVLRQNDGRYRVSSMIGVSSPHTPPIDGRTVEITKAFPSESIRDLTQVDTNCWPEMNGNWYPGFFNARTNRFSFWLPNGDGAESSRFLFEVDLDSGKGIRTEIREGGIEKVLHFKLQEL